MITPLNGRLDPPYPGAGPRRASSVICRHCTKLSPESDTVSRKVRSVARGLKAGSCMSVRPDEEALLLYPCEVMKAVGVYKHFQQNILIPWMYSSGVTPESYRLSYNSGRLCDHEPVQNKDQFKEVLKIILFILKKCKNKAKFKFHQMRHQIFT